jgi:DNA-binding SARP family transcriptional activator
LSGLIEQRASEVAVAIPSLVAVRVGAGRMEVVLSPPAYGRLGWFNPNEDGSALVLDPDVELDELRLLAAERWSAWPALVSLGDSGETDLLVNLERLGSLSVEGSPVRVRAVLSAVVLQLASQPWAQEMLGGLYALGDPPLDERLTTVQRIGPDKAMELAEQLDQVSTARQQVSDEVSLSSLRAIACEALPHVAVAFDGAPADALRCLAEAAAPERSGVVLVGAGPFTGSGWRLLVDDDGKGRLEGELAGQSISWQLHTRSGLEEAALMVEALGTASDRDVIVESPLDPGEKDLPFQPAGPVVSGDADHSENPPEGDGEPVTQLGLERSAVEVLLLGPVDIAGGALTTLDPSRRMAALGLLAFMVTHGQPVSADQLGSALWPLEVSNEAFAGPQRKTVMNVISRARSVLGFGTGGKERLVHTGQGYRLSNEVGSDWARFNKLVGAARGLSPERAVPLLRKALELVRGEPFGSALSSQFFEWVASEHLDMTMSAKVVDSAQDLGEQALQMGDLATVLWAVEKGLLLEPTREEMFRLWMHALGRMGRTSGVDDVYRRLKLVLRQRVHPLQEPQAESYAVWHTYTAAQLMGSTR